MAEIQPIRILHISDFHLNGKYVDDAKTLLQNMLDAIENANLQIDLVIFSGDMIDKGGKDFSGGITEALNTFKTEIIDEICSKLKLTIERLVFTPGNHDVNTQKADELTDEGIENNYMINESKVSTFIKGPNLFRSKYFQRIEDVKEFEKNYYESIMKDDYTYDLLASNFKYLIKDTKIGITSLNSSWRYNDENKRKNLIVLGCDQITDSHPKIKDCQLKLAVTHYDYTELPEFEQETVKNMIAQNYDVLFVGHTHSSSVEFINTSSGASFLHMKTAGSLIGNKYISSIEYQNAFHILSYYPDHIDVVLFEQKNGQFFEQNKSFGNLGDSSGIYREQIPTKEKSIEIAAVKKKEEEQKQANEFEKVITPFTSIEKFLSKVKDNLFKWDFVSCPKIEEITATLKEDSSKDIHFLALSGMGKTRIVMEAFKDEDKVFYSPTANCANQLRVLVEKEKECTIIVDDCDNDQRRELKKITRTYGNNNRLITINNDLSPDEEFIDGDVLLKFEYDEATEIINKLIAKEDTLKTDENGALLIKEYAGNIPYMAILLIEAYKNRKTLKIDNADSLLSALLRGRNRKDEQQEKVLKSIALFNPLGYTIPVDDELNYVKSNNIIHHIAENQNVVDVLFQDTIKSFLEKRKLIEYRGNCIRVRPKPLAEWLTEYWLIEYGDSIPLIWSDLHEKNDDLSQRLIRALCNRIKDMSDYTHAQELFDKMHDTSNGSFHNERIAFSEEGSQLFLSMGVVSPVAVSNNLLSLLEVNCKDIAWLKEYISDNIRRNLVYALERMAILSSEAFPYVAKSLLILASAENETFSNNSTGQFTQLFHCFLSGTKAPLSARLQVLEDAKCDSLYFPIIIKAIDAAFKSRDFIRLETAWRILRSTEPIDYQPTPSEIRSYWNNCANLLLFISDQTSDFDEAIKKVINYHVPDFYRWNNSDILDKLLSHFGSKCNYDWPEIRKTLRFYIKFWSGKDTVNTTNATEWYSRFAPKSFLLRIKDAIDNKYVEDRRDFTQLHNEMFGLMEPFAKEFIEKKIYLTDEMHLILKDQELQSHWIAQQIAKEIDGNHIIISEILDSFFSFVKKEEPFFESPFITQICIELSRNRDESIIEIEKGFQEKLYDNNYCGLAASIEGIVDDEQHSSLPKVIHDVKTGKYDNHCINNYIHRYPWQHFLDYILDITENLINAGIDEDEVVFPYFTNGIMLNNVKEIKDENKLTKIENILLSYSFTGKFFNTAYQTVELMSYILESHNRPKFAQCVHKKIVEVLSSNDLSISNPFDTIYNVLLPKYQTIILDKLCEDIAAEDKRVNYFWKIQFDLGSGFGYGAGPLFRCDYGLLKNACLKNPKKLPSRMAQLCPVMESEKDPSDTFFWWLCDNFGDQKEMLESFEINMGTYSHTGTANDPLSNYIAEKQNILTPYTNHPNQTVQNWAKKQIESIQKDVEMHKKREEYRDVLRDK